MPFNEYLNEFFDRLSSSKLSLTETQNDWMHEFIVKRFSVMMSENNSIFFLMRNKNKSREQKNIKTNLVCMMIKHCFNNNIIL